MRNRRRTRSNPQWSWDVLDKIWPRLQELVPDRLMPIEERIEMPKAVNPGRRRRNPQVKEYGSGHYGVVMPTKDPRWVFKLTTDRSEAQFINAVRKLGSICSLNGICRYSTVYDTGLRQAKSSAQRIYAVWREAADVAGEDVWTWFANSPRKNFARAARNAIYDGLDALRSDGEGIEYLAAAEVALRSWNTTMLADTADDLLNLMGAGIVVTDVHLGNWGIVPRRPKLLTLIDPGMVRFVTPEAKELASGIPLL